MHNGILPVINENDTIATEEIKFGDNDRLSALTAILLDVDLLILATNTNGIYDNNKNTIAEITNIEEVRQYIETSFSDQGTGGMQSKLAAVKLVQSHHIESWIVNGHTNDFILDAMVGHTDFSKILVK